MGALAPWGGKPRGRDDLVADFAVAALKRRDKADLDHVGGMAQMWEKVVRKLRAGQMPPAGMPRPDAATYDSFTSNLENALDRAAARRAGHLRAQRGGGDECVHQHPKQ